MVHVRVVLAIGMLLIAAAIEGRAQESPPHRDFQAWTDLDATHRINRNIDFLVSTGIRYSNDFGHLSYRRITSGFAFRWHRYFTFEPYYQYSQSDSFSEGIRPENRLAMAITVGAPWKQWEISDRNKGERRFKANGRSWRYRNRVELRHPLNVERKRVSVFVWDEVYYSSHVGQWYRNRFALGIGQKLGRKMSVDVYYAHQNDGYDHPGNLNAIGMTIKTHF